MGNRAVKKEPLLDEYDTLDNDEDDGMRSVVHNVHNDEKRSRKTYRRPKKIPKKMMRRGRRKRTHKPDPDAWDHPNEIPETSCCGFVLMRRTHQMKSRFVQEEEITSSDSDHEIRCIQKLPIMEPIYGPRIQRGAMMPTEMDKLLYDTGMSLHALPPDEKECIQLWQAIELHQCDRAIEMVIANPGIACRIVKGKTAIDQIFVTSRMSNTMDLVDLDERHVMLIRTLHEAKAYARAENLIHAWRSDIVLKALLEAGADPADTVSDDVPHDGPALSAIQTLIVTKQTQLLESTKSVTSLNLLMKHLHDPSQWVDAGDAHGLFTLLNGLRAGFANVDATGYQTHHLILSCSDTHYRRCMFEQAGVNDMLLDCLVYVRGLVECVLEYMLLRSDSLRIAFKNS